MEIERTKDLNGSGRLLRIVGCDGCLRLALNKSNVVGVRVLGNLNDRWSEETGASFW